MLSVKETEIRLENFFKDCLAFWKREGYDDREAFELALSDTKTIKKDPFSPMGEELDAETKNKFIHYRTMDLGR